MKNTHLLSLTSNKTRVIALLLVLCMALSLAGCKEKGVKLVKHADIVGGYSFSYPKNWQVYSEGGSACLSIADVGGALPYAMVRFSAFDNESGQSAAEYWNAGVEGFSSVYDSYEIMQNRRGAFEKEGVNSAYYAVVQVSLKGETKLNGQPKEKGEAADYTVHQLVFEGDGRICVVSYMSAKGNYDEFSYVMDDIKDSFAFEKAVSESVADKGATEFTLPVPEGWQLDTAEAYYKLSCGKASVVACVYSMDKTVSAKKYWEEIYRDSVKVGISDFTEVSVTECKLDGIDAIDVYYTGSSVSGNKYNFRQCIAVKQSQAYIITLTADDADYKNAEIGYKAIIEGFNFK